MMVLYTYEDKTARTRPIPLQDVPFLAIYAIYYSLFINQKIGLISEFSKYRCGGIYFLDAHSSICYTKYDVMREWRIA